MKNVTFSQEQKDKLQNLLTHIGIQFRLRRQYLNLTMMKLAKKTPYVAKKLIQLIQRIETGKKPSSLLTLIFWADALDCDIEVRLIERNKPHGTK